MIGRAAIHYLNITGKHRSLPVTARLRSVREMREWFLNDYVRGS
jgi:hypothetical protein